MLKRGEPCRDPRDFHVDHIRRRFIRNIANVAIILLVPAIAMQFTDEVRWSPLDFLAAAALLLGAGLIYAFLSGRTSDGRYKAVIGLAVAAALFRIWLQLAAGIL